MTRSADVIHSLRFSSFSVGSRCSEWGLYHGLRHKILKILDVQGQTDKFKILNRPRSKKSPYVLVHRDHCEMFKSCKSAPMLCNFHRLSWLLGIFLSRMKIEVKERLGLEEKQALHYWEGLCHNGLCPAIKLYIPSLCLIFMRFPQYLRFLEGEICLVSLGCILLEVPPIPGCYHSPRVGTLCLLAPFDACHTLMFFSSCPMSLGQTFCELWG